MKKYLFAILFVLFSIGLFAQKVAIIGVSEDQPDGFSFVVLEPIEAGTRIYYTTEEYQSGACAYGELLEELAFWEAPSTGIMIGEVVFIKELDTAPNTFEIACSGGTGTDACGTFTLVSGNFNIGTQDELSLFRDDDNDLSTGIDTVYSIFYHDHRTAEVNAIPAGNDPRGDEPCGANTIVVDELIDSGAESGHVQYTGPRTLPIFRNNLEDPAYYTHGAGAADLDVTPFTGVSSAVEREAGNQMRLYPNPTGDELIITFDRPLGDQAAVEIYDLQGHLLQSRRAAVLDRQIEVPLASWPAGVYLLRVVAGEAVYARRFVKE